MTRLERIAADLLRHINAGRLTTSFLRTGFHDRMDIAELVDEGSREVAKLLDAEKAKPGTTP